MSKNKFIEYFGDIKTGSDERDVAFWKGLSTEQRFSAAWEIITDYYRDRGLEDELRFRRSIETAGEF